MRSQGSKCALALSFVSFLVASSASADYCINKDLMNLEPPAYDIAVLISGNQPVTFHYDGWAGGTFSSFTVTPSGGDELLHWQNLNGSNDPIPTGVIPPPPAEPVAQIHVGWCTVNPNDTLNMFWTDLSGVEIPGGIVFQVSGHQSGSPIAGVQWDNATNHPITVTNTYYSLSRTPWKLAALNRDNKVFAQGLRALPGGKSLTIAAKGRAELALPGARPGDWVVLVHNVTGSGTRAVVKDYVQFQLRETATP